MASARRTNRFVVGAALTAGAFLIWNLAGGGGSSYVNLAGGYSGGSGPEALLPSFVTLDSSIPETEYITGLPGFTYFKNVYLTGGVFHAVVTDPSTIPIPGYIMSAFPDDDGSTHKPAGEDRWRVLVKGKDDVAAVLGGVAVRKAGISMFFNDEKGKTSVSFLKHYFHFGEVFLGGWRVLATAGERDLPARLMYRTTPDDWRDAAGLTTWFQQSVMPNTAVEESTIWNDRAKSGTTFLFDKLTITDRWAAHALGENPKYWNKMTADLPLLDAPMDWMGPLRSSMKTLALADGCSVKRQKSNVPVVTYVNRQLTGRRLNSDDAEEFLKEMNKLHDEGVIEFNDAKMERKSRIEQFCMAMRSDIIMGVHGNGLSHALWMKPGSAVLEFMFPGGFARDYAMIAELMRHDYYAIHNDTVFTEDKWRKPDGYAVGQAQGFHGSNIPLDAKFIAGLTRKIAAEKRGMYEP